LKDAGAGYQFRVANECSMTVQGYRTKRMMDVREFEDLLDRLGEDLSRWPDAQRQAAVDLLSSSPEASALLAHAREMRDALSAPPVRAPAGLADRIFAAASRVKSDPSVEEEEAVAASADVTQPG
jgi:hypothetical protein